ncbi:MAG TPA: hypothetical protein VL337_01400 [Acidimicrobiales bacterium]|nr:hypothetical protein [Acidimicrobiales bacterium]
MLTIESVFFRPPLAFARLGRAASPMDNYVWREDPTIHGAARNIVEPALTLEVQPDGSIWPFIPTVLRFKQGNDLRPVAPFFELWARVQVGQDLAAAGSTEEVPVTLGLLEQAGAGLEDVAFGIAVANRKAARRTGDAANGFEANILVRGNDHERHQLLARTVPQPGSVPLVLADHPVPLGWFQVIRPVAVQAAGVDLGVLRVRFTPGGGEVYGPPTAAMGQDDATGRFYEMVPAENRILNPAASWLRYDGDYTTFTNPEPSDTYDGADQGANVSWGVVDDTCDGVITAELVVAGRRFVASARVSAGPPDYAPDRRPFASLADDLADRDLDPASADDLLAAEADTQARLADLFQRVWETAGLVNVDAIRARALSDNSYLSDNAKVDDLPYTDWRSMRPQDTPYADAKVEAVIPSTGTEPRLPWSQLVGLAHDPLAEEDELIDFMLTQADRVRQMVRPPYGAVSELQPTVTADQEPGPSVRDPRITRDLMHDMRMPPYMRDEMARALGLTRRQFIELMRYVEAIAAAKPPGRGESLLAGTAKATPDAAARRPVRRRVAQRLQRGLRADGGES